MDVLLEAVHQILSYETQCFNPYCNGCTSRRPCSREGIAHRSRKVSILIVMDVLLEGPKMWKVVSCISCFNPYCNGCTSRRVNYFKAKVKKFQSLL